MLKWVRLTTETLKHREEVKDQKTEGKRADQLEGVEVRS